MISHRSSFRGAAELERPQLLAGLRVERAEAAIVGGADETVVVAHGGVIIALERALGVWRDGNRHPHLGGWWVESQGVGPDPELVALRKVDLLASPPETVTGPA